MVSKASCTIFAHISALVVEVERPASAIFHAQRDLMLDLSQSGITQKRTRVFFSQISIHKFLASNNTSNNGRFMKRHKLHLMS